MWLPQAAACKPLHLVTGKLLNDRGSPPQRHAAPFLGPWDPAKFTLTVALMARYALEQWEGLLYRRSSAVQGEEPVVDSGLQRHRAGEVGAVYALEIIHFVHVISCQPFDLRGKTSVMQFKIKSSVSKRHELEYVITLPLPAVLMLWSDPLFNN